MPDIGLFELMLIGVLLFIVVGPERMPEFFGQIARWMRSGRNWMNQFRSELSRETADLSAPIREARSQVEQGLDSIAVTAREVGDGLQTPADAPDTGRDGDSGKQG